VTGDNDAMATGDNSSHCTCLFGSLCPFVEVGSLMRRLPLPDDNDDGDDDGDDNDGNGVMGDDDAMAMGDNGSHCACSFESLCPFVEVRSLMHRLVLPDDDDNDNDDDGNGVTGEEGGWRGGGMSTGAASVGLTTTASVGPPEPPWLLLRWLSRGWSLPGATGPCR